MDYDQLKLQIEAAFADVAMPASPQELAMRSEYYEAEDFADFLGMKWQDMDAGWLSRHLECIEYMTPAAFRYYLPAYLVAAAADEEQDEQPCQDPDRIQRDLILAHLVPAAAEYISDWRNPGCIQTDLIVAHLMAALSYPPCKDAVPTSRGLHAFCRRVSILTDEQKDAVRNFLLLMECNYHRRQATWALDTYWRKQFWLDTDWESWSFGRE